MEIDLSELLVDFVCGQFACDEGNRETGWGIGPLARLIDIGHVGLDSAGYADEAILCRHWLVGKSPAGDCTMGGTGNPLDGKRGGKKTVDNFSV